MKIAVYNYRKFDEGKYFEKFAEKYGVEILPILESPTKETLKKAKGCDAISCITTPIKAEFLKSWAKMGIKHVSTRTIGFDHIDLEAAKKYGVGISNVTYSTGSVADYAVMMILMALRRMKTIVRRADAWDYSLDGNIGMEIKDLTVGIVGTGKIGSHVIRNLSGFGCKIIAYDPYENEEVKKFASYMSLEKLLKEADVISFHAPATDDNFHLVNKESIATMKDGVIIVNTARGSLIDTEDFIEALESGKIGAAALDVVENETGLYYGDHKSEVLKNRELAILRDMPNVLVTPHMAFYTENAISDMVEHSICHIINGDGNVIPESN